MHDVAVAFARTACLCCFVVISFQEPVLHLTFLSVHCSSSPGRRLYETIQPNCSEGHLCCWAGKLNISWTLRNKFKILTLQVNTPVVFMREFVIISSYQQANVATFRILECVHAVFPWLIWLQNLSRGFIQILVVLFFFKMHQCGGQVWAAKESVRFFSLTYPPAFCGTLQFVCGI